jgi:hypothetical protein
MPVRFPSRAACLALPALLAPLFASPALAQGQLTFSCATGDASNTRATSGEQRPVPRILRYGVAAATDPAAPPLRESREATVTGGDAARGWLRIDVVFDAAIPRDCKLPLKLTTATDQGGARDTGVGAQLTRVLDGLEPIAGGGTSVMDHLAGALTFTGNGSDTASFRIPIRATESAGPDRHALKLVMASDYAGGLPFTVVVNPLPVFSLVPPGGPLTAGTPTLLRAQHPVGLLPGTAAMPTRFRLTPATLGRWQGASTATPAEMTSRWDDRFAPMRSEAALVPALIDQPTQGTVTVTFAGRSQSMPVAINPAPPSCDPAFALAAAPGGLRLTMTNRSRGDCPAHVATPLMPARAIFQLGPAQATVQTASVSGLRPVSPAPGLRATSVPMLSAQRNDGGALFTINRMALIQLAVGTRFDIDVQPEGASGSTGKRRIGITLTAADLAVIRGQ